MNFKFSTAIDLNKFLLQICTEVRTYRGLPSYMCTTLEYFLYPTKLPKTKPTKLPFIRSKCLSKCSFLINFGINYNENITEDV